MIGEIIKIRFCNDTASLCDKSQIRISELFSDDEFMASKKSPSESFLEVKILNYSSVDCKLDVDILSYNRGPCNFNFNQIKLSNELSNIKSIAIRSSDTFKIIAMFKEGVGNVKSPHKGEKYFQPNTGKYSSLNYDPFEEKSRSNNIHEEPNEERFRDVMISETFQIAFNKLSFESGFVSFRIWIDDLKQEIKFQIHNSYVREEYDAIKNYISNVLNSKVINVYINIISKDGSIENISAKSDDIDKIDDKLIDKVKFKVIQKIKKNDDMEIDKSIFTMDEYFDTYSAEKIKSKTFYSKDTDFLNDLLKIHKTKHYKNLEYLSSKHAHEKMKLRFVPKPFSFIFLLEGDINYHIIWETFDTKEATYIWHLEKNKDILKQFINNKLDAIINTIKVDGKIAYLNFNGDKFERIYHDYLVLVEGFVKWKGEIESKIT